MSSAAMAMTLPASSVLSLMVAASWKHYSIGAKRPWVLADAKPERYRTFGETKIEHAEELRGFFLEQGL